MAGWKTGDFVDTPGDVKSQESGSVDIHERKIDINVGNTLTSVHYFEVNSQMKLHPPVLLLHGMAFKAETWRDLGTLALLGVMGHRAVALDLPGFGKTKAADFTRAERAKFLGEITRELSLQKPVLVSPSMSGGYALPYLLTNPQVSTDICSGFIPIAPVDTGTYQSEDYQQAGALPVAIVYGSNDTRLGEVSLGNLSKFTKHEIICFQDAGHACYMNNPAVWHKTLYNFLSMIR